MTLSTAVSRFRRRQADLLMDTATIRRPPAKVFNPTTNTYSAAPGPTVYSGHCLIRPGIASSQAEVQAQQTEVNVNRFLAKFPIDTDGTIGDVVTVDESTYDAGLVGRSMVVVDIQLDGWQICRRLVLEENRG